MLGTAPGLGMMFGFGANRGDLRFYTPLLPVLSTMEGAASLLPQKKVPGLCVHALMLSAEEGALPLCPPFK
jgi:hypothetical protein